MVLEEIRGLVVRQKAHDRRVPGLGSNPLDKETISYAPFIWIKLWKQI